MTQPAKRGYMTEIIARHLVYDGWYKFFRLEMRMPDGKVVERHLLDNGSAVAVLPYDPARRVAMLITQPRAAVIEAAAPPLLEVIAGNIDGQPIEAQTRTEALEEAGLRLGELEPVANIWPIPPVSTERVQLFLAKYCAADRVGPGGGAAHEDEHISVYEIGLDTLWDMVSQGSLVDAKTLVCAQALMLRHPELF